MRRLLIELQSLCCGATEKALKAFLTKDISLAEDVRELHKEVEKNYSQIEAAAKESSVDLMPQILSDMSFLRQVYERSVDMADLVV
jgi:phosphate uptake regulator